MTDTEIREEPITSDVVKKFCSQVHSMKEIGLSRTQPFDQIFCSGRVTDFYKGIQDFEVFEDDLWVTGFPKSGKVCWPKKSYTLFFIRIILYKNIHDEIGRKVKNVLRI